MNRRQKTWAALAAFHLLLVAVGATQLRPHQPNAAFNLFDFYGALSGANTGYGFFAPEIGSELRARFLIAAPDGSTYEDSLQRGVTREASLRIGNIVGIISQRISDVPARRLIAGSWAGKMFARHPEAREVTVILEGYDLPSLRDWPSVKKTGWLPFYRASYVRSMPSAAGRVR